MYTPGPAISRLTRCSDFPQKLHRPQSDIASRLSARSPAGEACDYRVSSNRLSSASTRHSICANTRNFGREIGADRPCRDDARVPTISRFLGLVITMYFDDHDPPHFHALHADGEAKVRIDSLELIESTLPRRQVRFVLAWAELHQEELAQNWRRARAGETLQAIEPLQ